MQITIIARCIKITEPFRGILVLIAYVNSEYPDEPEHPRSQARYVASRIRKEGIWIKAYAKIYASVPTR